MVTGSTKELAGMATAEEQGQHRLLAEKETAHACSRDTTSAPTSTTKITTSDTGAAPGQTEQVPTRSTFTSACFIGVFSLFAGIHHIWSIGWDNFLEELKIENPKVLQLCMNANTYYREQVERVLSHVTDANMFLVQSVVTCGALFWLLHRAWLTLWKPVPELIDILGVEVPDPPAVSLAGIKADSITLHWTRPGPNKPVLKYLIQVNGVNVGESLRLETAITVTGLKALHYYNVRVIAVGSNNFQAASGVIRLRTYDRNGRPQLANGRVPSNLSIEDQQSGALAESSDESPAGRNQAAGIETAAVPGDIPSTTREPTSTSGQRRNTGGRKHSPSNAADQAALARRQANQPEVSMQQLTEKFEAIRKQTEEVTTQASKDTENQTKELLNLIKERDEKRTALKEKEDASETLKKEVNASERANRLAQNRKTIKEKLLREKQSERTKMQNDMIRWEKEIKDMREEREYWQAEKEKMALTNEKKTDELHTMIQERQSALNIAEETIRVKGLQIKELEEARKLLPGAQDDEESRSRDAEAAQLTAEWDIKERGLGVQLQQQLSALRHAEADFLIQQNLWNGLAARHSNNSLMYHGNSSGVDFDQTGSQGKAKSRRSRNRKSRTSTISSPTSGYPITDSNFPSASTYNNLTTTTTASPSFAPGALYFDFRNDTAMVPLSEHMAGMSEADIRSLTAGAPLSPTATSLLPSNIFEGDDDPPSPRAGSTRSFGPALYGARPSHDNDPQSPNSSSRSPSLMSSPQNSSHNLALYGVAALDYAESDRRSLKSPRELGAIGSSNASDQPSSQRSFANIFTFPRARGKTMQENGPALGSLKQGQSQSFPRSTEEPETIANRPRRISFSSGWSVPSLFNRSSASGDATEGNGPAPARNTGARRRRGFNMFTNSMDDPTAIYSDRDPSSPRPLSVASSELPRPSTDSAPFGWPAVEGAVINRNSPLATNWSINAPQTWSRNPSRRPSFQHGSGSTTALVPSGIAQEDDEFLPPDTLLGQSSPPPVGVIGSRPLSSHKPITPKLNPAAPTFKTIFTRASKADKAKPKEKTAESTRASEDHSQTTSSPADSRMSRDSPSIRTQNSLAESHESLDRISSNTPSEMAVSNSAKDKESSFRQLLRKGSSSKFSLSSIRGKDSGLFSGKKGPSSATNSDRNASADRDDSLDGLNEIGRGVDSVTSSPMIGSLGSSDWGKKENITPKEGRINWPRFGRKDKDKSKARESLDVDRSEAELTGTEDEGVY